MLENETEIREQPEDTSEARVARTGAGTSHYNTLTPRWDFAFSV